jgi:hypothetical protein
MRNAIRLFLTGFRVGTAAVALVVLASTSYAQTITTFDPPNSAFTIAQAINPVGQIVGYYLDGAVSTAFCGSRAAPSPRSMSVVTVFS